MDAAASRPTVTYYFDFVCPFCYLGAHRLLRLARRWAFEIAWEGIQIHPETPPEGRPLAALGEEVVRRAAAGIVALAEEEGVELKLPLVLANSALAHRMGELARRQGCFDAYRDRVFAACFQEGRNLGDAETIPAIVRGLGIPRVAIGRFLDDREGYARLIAARLRRVAEYGFRAFPAVVMGGRSWQGVQPEAVWEAGLEALGCRRRESI
ncbi:MAG: hypothetical protein D6739_07710 [Nitrospirae bacterium]|nr:MAG: hypothetical protein D6739_07710 [Nitrospirota bacterium]